MERCDGWNTMWLRAETVGMDVMAHASRQLHESWGGLA